MASRALHVATTAALFIGTYVLAPWPVLYLFSYGSTCTMGSDDSWMATLYLCTILTVVSLPLLAASVRHAHAWRVVVPLLTLPPLVLSLPHAIQTGFGAHHICGEGYDEYLTLREGLPDASTWFYRVMWVYGLVLSALALAPFAHRRPDAAPADAAPARRAGCA